MELAVAQVDNNGEIDESQDKPILRLYFVQELQYVCIRIDFRGTCVGLSIEEARRFLKNQTYFCQEVESNRIRERCFYFPDSDITVYPRVGKLRICQQCDEVTLLFEHLSDIFQIVSAFLCNIDQRMANTKHIVRMAWVVHLVRELQKYPVHQNWTSTVYMFYKEADLKINPRHVYLLAKDVARTLGDTLIDPNPKSQLENRSFITDVEYRMDDIYLLCDKLYWSR